MFGFVKEIRIPEFFYISMKAKRNHNAIKCIEDGNVRLTNKATIEDHSSRFYHELYNHESRTQAHWDLCDYVPKLSEDDIKSLCKWVTEEKIEAIVRNANPDKSHGPDGFNGFFYKDN